MDNWKLCMYYEGGIRNPIITDGFDSYEECRKAGQDCLDIHNQELVKNGYPTSTSYFIVDNG